MKINKNATVFVPDGKDFEAAVKRTTHLAIAAHQDDIEFMAYSPVAECFGSQNKWFCGVVVTDGGGSPRNGIYANCTDADMKRIRIEEQKKAAVIGEYGVQLLLGYTSSQVKSGDKDLVSDLVQILRAAKPRYVYVHNLADKHATHVATAIRAIAALRELKSDELPEKVYGCEVWRDLDWMNDEEKVFLDCSAMPNISRALAGVFDSQISGGKKYDSAAEGRRLANATFSASHACDSYSMLNYAMDITPLAYDKTMDIAEYVTAYILRFCKSVKDTIESFK